ncbi:MAG: RIP metalloprotease RseP [Candidatus Eisenbacteria bacterium]|uniref:Zinc metalloprotease n=1 Tax=Eiseniibacteriota bacterium TaxID=2212470 RepID=A0A849SMY7_UNCEI|nr:RIP metalloprotease RseP [Candidatus Eisenbacteria bacterium]
MLNTPVVPGVLLLGLVIFVHELGHFIAAKLRGVRVLRFSLGFGPRLIAVTRGETEYRLSWIPLGGYVQMAGDSPDETGSMPDTPDHFLSHPWYGRLFIAAAGPLANLITAFLVLVGVALTGVSYPDYPNRLGVTPDTSVAYQMGLREGDRIVRVGAAPVASWIPIFLGASKVPTDQPLELGVTRGDSTFALSLSAVDREPLMSSLHRPPDPPVIGNVVTGMPAYKAGLKVGDRITSVNGTPIANWNELPPAFDGLANQKVQLHIVREGRAFPIEVKPIDPTGGPEGKQGRIGIEPPVQGVYVERHPLLASIDIGFRATGEAVVSVYGGMWLTFSRPLYYREYLGGPIFIAQAASEQARRSLDSYLRFLAMINVAIMAFNLLPIPVLDGGHIVLALLQAVRRRPISTRGYLRFQKVGLVVVGSLLLLILANDPLRLVQRQRALDRAPKEVQVAPTPP